jgi:hypothetical protein
MWAYLGLLSLGALLWWQIHFRWTGRWKGKDLLAPGADARVRALFVKNKDTLIALEFGCAVPTHLRFELKRETGVDRFFKWLGLAVERQFGQSQFDQLVYVASNDDYFVKQFSENKTIVEAATRLFDTEDPICVLKKVVCANGHLYARLTTQNLFKREEDEKHLVQAALALSGHLLAIANEVRDSKAPPQGVGARDPYLLRGIVLLSISAAMAFHGSAFLMRSYFFEDQFLIDTWRIVTLSLLTAVAILAVLVAANLLLLARSARAHLVLLELLLVGSFGAFTSSAAELRDANIEWDTAQPTELTPVVQHKSISKSRRSTSYYVHIPDWDRPNRSEKIRVSSSFYKQVQIGDQLLVDQYPGYFGARWARVTGARAPAEIPAN